MTAAPDSMVPPQQAAVNAALLVLKSMGLSVEDLTGAASDRAPVPTFAEYVPVIAATLTGSTLRAYSSYWKRTVEQWAAGAWTSRRRRRSGNSRPTSRRTRCSAVTAGAGATLPRT